MATINIGKNENVWLILKNGSSISYYYSGLDQCTTFNETWSCDLFPDEESWLAELEQLGVVDEELGLGQVTSPPITSP